MSVFIVLAIGFFLQHGYLHATVELQTLTPVESRDAFLGDLHHLLDMSGMNVLDDVQGYSRDLEDSKATDYASSERNDEDEETELLRHRRSIQTTMKIVKESQKVGNREELLLRGASPMTNASTDVFYNASHILPLKLTQPTDRFKFFGIARGMGTSLIYIVKLDKLSNKFSIHQTLPERDAIKMSITKSYVDRSTMETLFAVAGRTLSIYKIGSGPNFSFLKIQSNPTPMVRAVTFVEIQKATYLIFGTYFTNAGGSQQFQWRSQVQIYIYDPNSRFFHFHSVLPGSGVTDIECFTVQTKTFMIVANYRDSIGNLNINSQVFEYNINYRRFQMIQDLVTKGAVDVEHFVLSNEDYIVIANEASGSVDNKMLNVKSDIYKLLQNDKFQLVQTIDTYGAKELKSIAVPNCKQDVLLIYSDQRNNVDQVGVYSFSHDNEEFNVAQLSLYPLEAVNSTFRPEPKTIATFSSQDYDTGEYSLFVVIGAGNNEEGNAVYKLSYEIVLRDSPLEAFKRFVVSELAALNETLASVKELIDQAEISIENAVLRNEKTNITGIKTVTNNLTMDEAIIDELNITKKSLLYKAADDTTYMANPSLVEPVDFAQLQLNATAHEKVINSIVDFKETFLYTNKPQKVTAEIRFQHVSSDSIAINGNFTSRTINNIKLNTLFANTVTSKTNITITSRKTFSRSALFNTLSVDGMVNGISFPEHVVISGIDQTISGSKTFSSYFNALKNFETSKLSGVNLITDAVYVNRAADITSEKHFSNGLSMGRLTINGLMNEFSLTELFEDNFRKSIPQNVTGHKIFKTIKSLDNVKIEGSVNGVDLQGLLFALGQRGRSKNVDGNKEFLSSINITGNLYCSELINGLQIPEAVLVNNQSYVLTHNQQFKNNVHAMKNWNASSTINNIETTSLVVLDKNKTLQGMTFKNDVNINKNLVISQNHTINKIDLSEFEKNLVNLGGDQNLTQLEFKDDVSIYKHTISKINNKSMSDLQQIYTRSLLLNENQNISVASVTFTNTVGISGELTAFNINGYLFPDDFAIITGENLFNGHITFLDLVTFINVSIDTMEKINVSKYFNELCLKDRNINFTNPISFDSMVTAYSSISPQTVNQIDLSEDIILRNVDQEITAMKNIKMLDISNNHVTILGNLEVQNLIDGVDLSQLNLDGMTISGNETITGEKCFESTDYNRSVEYVNNIDLSALKDDIVTIDTEQIIEADKVFHDISIKNDIVTISTVNSIDVSKLKEQTVISGVPATLSSLHIKGYVTVLGDVDIAWFNSINISDLANILISKSNSGHISNLVVNGVVTAINLESETVNGLHLNEDLIYRSTDQVVTGYKAFKNINASRIISTNINNVNFDQLRRMVVYNHGDQTINGLKFFQNRAICTGDVVTDTVNAISLNDWKYIRTDGITEQVVTGKHTFEYGSQFQIFAASLINGVNFTEIVNKAVLADQNQHIKSVVNFKQGISAHNLKITSQDLEIIGDINGVDVEDMSNDLLKIHGDQHLKDLTINGKIYVTNLISNTTDGLKIPDDLLTKYTTQYVNGEFTFQDVAFEDGMDAGSVDHVNIAHIAESSLLVSKNEKQIMSGHVKFENEVLLNILETDQSINNITFETNNFATLQTDQETTTSFLFTENLNVGDLTVKQHVNGIDLFFLNKTRILKHTSEIIQGDVTFYGSVNANGNVIITGLVNELDLSNYNHTSPDVGPVVDKMQSELSGSLSQQCKALNSITGALEGYGYRYDYLTLEQYLPYPFIKNMEQFIINDDVYMTVAISSSSYSFCTNSHILKLDRTNGRFVEYQSILTAKVKKMEILVTPWSAVYLFVLNQYEGCHKAQGGTQLYKWNSTTASFRHQVSTNDTSLLDIIWFYKNGKINVFLSKTKLVIDQNSISLYQTSMLSSKSADLVHGFTVGETNYVSIGVKVRNDSSQGFMRIYQVDQENEILSIQTPGLSDIKSFTFDGETYIILANDRQESSSGYATYDVHTDVYKFNPNTNILEHVQSIPTYRNVHISVHSFGTQILITLTHFERSISIYRFALALGFLLVDELRCEGCTSATFIDHDQTTYLMVTSDSDSATRILKLSGIGVDQELLPSNQNC